MPPKTDLRRLSLDHLHRCIHLIELHEGDDEEARRKLSLLREEVRRRTSAAMAADGMLDLGDDPENRMHEADEKLESTGSRFRFFGADGLQGHVIDALNDGKLPVALRSQWDTSATYEAFLARNIAPWTSTYLKKLGLPRDGIINSVTVGAAAEWFRRDCVVMSKSTVHAARDSAAGLDAQVEKLTALLAKFMTPSAATDKISPFQSASGAPSLDAYIAMPDTQHFYKLMHAIRQVDPDRIGPGPHQWARYEAQRELLMAIAKQELPATEAEMALFPVDQTKSHGSPYIQAVEKWLQRFPK